MPNYFNVLPGDPAPSFRQRSATNPNYSFDSAAGRYLVLCFVGSASDPQARAAIAAMRALPDVFDDTQAALFFVSNDPADEAEGRIEERIPGYRVFWDSDGRVSRLYGVAPVEETDMTTTMIRRSWVLIDPTLRVRAVVPFNADGSDIGVVTAILRALPPPELFAGFPVQAPIIILPQVFELDLCKRLIQLYDTDGGVESGFMRDVDGKTVGVHDHSHKRRRDYVIDDPAVITHLQGRFIRRVVPEIAKVHQYKVTRMERYLVGCYTAEDGGHFRAHRDNTTKGTAHRRFAVSVNLNDEFDGGEVSFPEYGPKSFKAPPGGAVVFSCSLLHAVSKVTRGRRYAFLPFLYDDAAAKIREENNIHLDESVGIYRG
jgi:peroxiredoxin/predicted 2-oxoglutarate/Fe(II)-dependent dioxygenase YbiX